MKLKSITRMAEGYEVVLLGDGECTLWHTDLQFLRKWARGVLFNSCTPQTTMREFDDEFDVFERLDKNREILMWEGVESSYGSDYAFFNGSYIDIWYEHDAWVVNYKYKIRKSNLTDKKSAMIWVEQNCRSWLDK